MTGIRVLSLFDGIACARIALQKSGIPVAKYYASEINAKAISVATANWHDIEHVGSVESVLQKLINDSREFGMIDFVVFGSPCQDLSISKKKREGLNGAQSGLFYIAKKIIDILKPRFFLMENVASMNNESRDIITNELGVQPRRIDSRQLSALSRPRYYWCNWYVDTSSIGGDSTLVMGDIMQSCVASRFHLSSKALDRIENIKLRAAKRKYGYKDCILGPKSKMLCLDANYGKGPDGKRGIYRASENDPIRLVTPTEAERFQGVPDEYTATEKSMTARYYMLGNGFTVQVIEFLLTENKEW